MNLDGDLLSLIRDGANDAVKAIIQKFNFYREVDFCGNTLLHHCAELGNQIIAKYLLEGGSIVDAQNELGFTPLMKALIKSNESVVEMLLEAGADVLLLNNDQKSSLHLILIERAERSAIIKLAVNWFRKQRFRDPQGTARRLIDTGFGLHQVTILQDARILEYMLQHSNFQANVSKKCSPDVAAGGQTPLHLAASACNLECVKVLLKYGADPDAKNAWGKTSLYYVYFDAKKRQQDQFEIFNVLLNATFATMSDHSQLSSTLALGPREAVNRVLNLNLDLNTQDKLKGMTVLHYIAINLNPGIVDELKIHMRKFNVNILSKEGFIPLFQAAKHCNVKMVEYLLQQGANINSMENIHKCPPILGACWHDHEDLEYQADECIEVFLQQNADVQFVIDRNYQLFTIFDVTLKAIKNSREDRLKPIVAHLALLEKRGATITEIIKSKIDVEPPIKKYFIQCRQILNKKVTDGVTILQLLTTNDKTIIKYLNDNTLMKKLKRLSHCCELKSDYSYYFNTLKKQFTKAFLLRILKTKAAEVITQLSKYKLDGSNIATENIIRYLDEQALRELYQM